MKSKSQNTGYFDWLRSVKASLSCIVKYGTLTTTHTTQNPNTLTFTILTHAYSKFSHDTMRLVLRINVVKVVVGLSNLRDPKLPKPKAKYESSVMWQWQRQRHWQRQSQRQNQSRSRATSVRIARMAMNESRFSTKKVVDLCSCRVRWLLRRVPLTVHRSTVHRLPLKFRNSRRSMHGSHLNLSSSRIAYRVLITLNR